MLMEISSDVVGDDEEFRGMGEQNKVLAVY